MLTNLSSLNKQKGEYDTFGLNGIIISYNSESELYR